MSSNESARETLKRGSTGRRIPWRTLLVLVVVVLAGGAWLSRGGGDSVHVTFAVLRGPLEVRVLEGGNVSALESQEIRSEVQGYPGTKILSIVEEGHFVTEEEVAAKMILVELDSSEFSDRLTTAMITIKGTEASLTEARQSYDIQINQSESDIYSAGITLKFALMELRKYLGEAVTADLLEEANAFEGGRERTSVLNLVEERIISETAPSGEAQGGEDQERFRVSLESLRHRRPEIDFSVYANPELLGKGEANQMLRKFEDDYLLAQKELGASVAQLAGTERLYEQNFVTKVEYEKDKLEHERRQIAVLSAEAARDLFMRFEFPKEAEQKFSDYIQARRALQRTEKKALSELASAEAKLLSAEARFRIEGEHIKELEEQIAYCTMRAERSGLVVYGGGRQMYWDQESQIKEGTLVRQRQTIITIPDMTKMGVKVKIHETDIKLVKTGQTVTIRVDAQSDTPLRGKVTKVAVLPNSEDRYMNPDLKVYQTTISIEGTHEWLKPGMSAEVDILIKTLDDVLHIPIQSVIPQGGKQVCFVLEDGEIAPREVETGDLTVEYIAILSGLKEGEHVLLRPPEGARRDEPDSAPEPEPEALEALTTADAVEATTRTTGK